MGVNYVGEKKILFKKAIFRVDARAPIRKTPVVRILAILNSKVSQNSCYCNLPNLSEFLIGTTQYRFVLAEASFYRSLNRIVLMLVNLSLFYCIDMLCCLTFIFIG